MRQTVRIDIRQAVEEQRKGGVDSEKQAAADVIGAFLIPTFLSGIVSGLSVQSFTLWICVPGPAFGLALSLGSHLALHNMNAGRCVKLVAGSTAAWTSAVAMGWVRTQYLGVFSPVNDVSELLMYILCGAIGGAAVVASLWWSMPEALPGLPKSAQVAFVIGAGLAMTHYGCHRVWQQTSLSTMLSYTKISMVSYSIWQLGMALAVASLVNQARRSKVTTT